MSKFGFVAVLLLMVGRTNAQDIPAPDNKPLTYFVLIQADGGQPFYVRLDNQLFPSSPGGHLILSQLKDSVYSITVGFPAQTFPERNYLLDIHHKDLAFRLSRQDNRWGLYDDQGQPVSSAADSAMGEQPPLTGTKKDDAFSKLMSDIVQDTAVMYNTYAATAPDSSVQQPATGSTPAIPNAASSAIKPIDSSSIPSAPTGVVKLSERKSTQSLSLVYADHPANQKPDTIDVVIPVDSGAATNHRPKSSDTSRTMLGHPAKSDTPTVILAPHKTEIPFVNSDCHAFATDYDVDKLRARMLNADKDEDRIQTAYKIFKTKCFSTKQVRALSEVFRTDAARFKFLETAYPFVSDAHFSELLSVLSDPVYIERFRNMVDHL